MANESNLIPQNNTSKNKESPLKFQRFKGDFDFYLHYIYVMYLMAGLSTYFNVFRLCGTLVARILVHRSPRILGGYLSMMRVDCSCHFDGRMSHEDLSHV